MSTKSLIAILVILLVVAGILYSVGRTSPELVPMATNNEIKNADMMNGTSTREITIQENLEYFPGAKGYFVKPAAEGLYPGVVMIHENRGLRPEIKQTAETLAKEGYMVLAVDLLGGTAEDQAGARALTAKFNQATGTANMRAAAAYLRQQGASADDNLSNLRSLEKNLMRQSCITAGEWQPRLSVSLQSNGPCLESSATRTRLFQWLL